MKLRDIITALDAEVVSAEDLDKEISGGYCGDFLSFVMAQAPAGCAWFTVMSNHNVAAVAALTEVGVTILCEGVKPDDQLKAKAVGRGLDLIVTDKPVYEAVKALDL